MSALHDHPLLVSTRFGRRHANRVAAWLASSRQTAISYGMYAPAVEAALSAAADAMLRQAVDMLDPPAARAAAEFLDRLVG